MSLAKRTKVADGVFFTSIEDSRFKTIKMTINFIVPLNFNTAAPFALLGGVLTRSCMAYPDFTALSKKLSSMYGADLDFSFSKLGDNQILSFSISGIDSRYALESEGDFTDELVGLLYNIIFIPNFQEGKFKESEIDLERKQLLDMIDAEFNDKRIYANNKMIEIMCKEEVFGVRRYGDPNNINTVSPAALREIWKEMLRKSVVEIFYIGESSSEKVSNMIRFAFDGINRNPFNLQTRVIRKACEVKRVSETMELAQSKLVMGFRTNCAVPDENVNATRLMCAILGGTASSKLFCNVREKQSLCYYCASRFIKHKGIMIIDSGVEGQNIEKAEQGILKEIEDMKNGVITDFEVESAKKALINSFYTSNDAVSGIEAWYTSQLFDGEFKTIEDVSNEINAVTKEQIVAAANLLTLDTVFSLKNS